MASLTRRLPSQFVSLPFSYSFFPPCSLPFPVQSSSGAAGRAPWPVPVPVPGAPCPPRAGSSGTPIPSIPPGRGSGGCHRCRCPPVSPCQPGPAGRRAAGSIPAPPAGERDAGSAVSLCQRQPGKQGKDRSTGVGRGSG